VADADQDLVGSIERVTASIPGAGPGAVLLTVPRGTEAFAAHAGQHVRRYVRMAGTECGSARSVIVVRPPT
jgi:hypothetical protein